MELWQIEQSAFIAVGTFIVFGIITLLSHRHNQLDEEIKSLDKGVNY